LEFFYEEPIRHDSMLRFSDTFADSGFDAGTHCASYGLAAATLFVASGNPGHGISANALGFNTLRAGEILSFFECGPSKQFVSYGHLWTSYHDLGFVNP